MHSSVIVYAISFFSLLFIFPTGSSEPVILTGNN